MVTEFLKSMFFFFVTKYVYYVFYNTACVGGCLIHCWVKWWDRVNYGDVLLFTMIYIVRNLNNMEKVAYKGQQVCLVKIKPTSVVPFWHQNDVVVYFDTAHLAPWNKVWGFFS
jgi:hypothetical protein